MNKTCSKAATQVQNTKFRSYPGIYQIPGIPRCIAWIENKKMLKLKLNVFSVWRCAGGKLIYLSVLIMLCD